MSTEFIPPRTEHVISPAEILKAIKGQAFPETNWFYSITREDAKRDPEMDGMYLFSQAYLVVKKARVDGFLEIDGLNLNRPDTPEGTLGLIFLDCILADIVIRHSTANELSFRRTLIDDSIHIVDDSHCEEIRMYDHCKCTAIYVYDRSKCDVIELFDHCLCDLIRIQSDGEGGRIRISDHSQCIRILLDHASCQDITADRTSIIGAFEGGVETGGIEILKRSKTGNVSLSEGSQCREMRVEDSSQTGNVSIDTNSTLYRGVTVENDGRCGDVSVYKNSVCGSISVVSSRCEGIYIGHDSTSHGIYIHDSKCKAIDISDRGKSGGLNIGFNSTVEKVTVNDGQSGNIDIRNSRVDRIQMNKNVCSLLFENANISSIELNDCLLHQIVWQGGVKGELFITGGCINYLNLYRTFLSRESIFSIVNSQIYIAQIQESLIHGQFILRTVSPVGLPFRWLPEVTIFLDDEDKEYGPEEIEKETLAQQTYACDWELEGLEKNAELKGRPRPLFRIVNSSLGRAEITGSDLSGFHFEYRDSKLMDTFISGTKLPKDRIEIYYPNIKNKQFDRDYFEQKVSVYNQFKRIFEIQGDIIEATWYYSKAMANHERLLTLQYAEKPKGRLFTWWSEEAFDLFNFRLNRLSNNHGESWRRALAFSFWLLFPVYILYFISVNYHRPFSWGGAGDFIGNFFSFLDITHKADFLVEKGQLNPASKIIDFFGRVLIGYCIYQFVAAFRRHGKKGG